MNTEHALVSLAHGASSLALGPAQAWRTVAGTQVSGPQSRPYRFCQNRKRSRGAKGQQRLPKTRRYEQPNVSAIFPTV